MVHPVHKSALKVGGLKPNKMQEISGSTPESREFIERQAISIFEDTVNAGQTFQCALAAILLSGMHWGIEIEKEKALNSKS